MGMFGRSTGRAWHQKAESSNATASSATEAAAPPSDQKRPSAPLGKGGFGGPAFGRNASRTSGALASQGAGRGADPKSSSGPPAPGGESESIFGNRDGAAPKQSPFARASATGGSWLKPQEGGFGKMAQGGKWARSGRSAGGKPP
jgi:hypothetical protein